MDEDESKPNCQDETESETSFDKGKSDKSEKDLSNFKSRTRRQRYERDGLMLRANSLKRAIRNLIEHAEQAVDEQNSHSPANIIPTIKISITGDYDSLDKEFKVMDTLKVSAIIIRTNCNITTNPT